MKYGEMGTLIELTVDSEHEVLPMFSAHAHTSHLGSDALEYEHARPAGLVGIRLIEHNHSVTAI
jgi:hypothetical protein